MAGATSYNGLSVKVSTPSGDPLPDVKILFRLPTTGPSGVFADGRLDEEVVSNAQGLAAVWGLRWGPTPGPCQVTVVASSGGMTAGTMFRVSIVAASSLPKSKGAPGSDVSFEVPVRREAEPPKDLSAPGAPSEHKPGVVLTPTLEPLDRVPGSRSKWAWILAIAGAAGGGLAYWYLHQNAPPRIGAVIAAPPPPVIGQPAITVGKP